MPTPHSTSSHTPVARRYRRAQRAGARRRVEWSGIAGLAGIVLLALGGAWSIREHEATDPIFGTDPRVWRPLVVPECYELAYTDPVGNVEPRLFPGWLTLKPSAGRADRGPVLSEMHPTVASQLNFRVRPQTRLCALLAS
jgi:hypothetical protein